MSPNRQYLGIACPTTPAYATRTCIKGKGKGSLYSITERSVPELISVLGSQPAGCQCHYFSARPVVTPATLREVLPILLLGEQRHNGCEQFA